MIVRVPGRDRIQRLQDGVIFLPCWSHACASHCSMLSLPNADFSSQISATARTPSTSKRVRSLFVLSGRGAPAAVISRAADRTWIAWAMQRIKADFCRSSDTHLLPVRLPAFPSIQLYLKDESTHVTGSLKHRLARSLFLYALTNGRLREGSVVVEASSGSTAISEAYFARLLRLPFVAVMPASTSKEKLALIEAEEGRCHLVDDSSKVYDVAAQLAEEAGGC